jgi:hypothetical protein
MDKINKNQLVSILISLFSIVIIFYSCITNNTTASKNKELKAILFDLDTCKYKLIEFTKIYKTHKYLHSLNEKDTFYISKDLLSIKTNKYYEQENDAQLLYSEISILFKNQNIVNIDSVLNIGSFNYDSINKILIIPAILYEMEDMEKATDLYVIDLKNNIVKLVRRDITNCTSGSVSMDAKLLYYNNGDSLLAYNFSTNSSFPIYYFDNPNLWIVNMKVIDSCKLQIYFYADFFNDFFNNRNLRIVDLNIKNVPRSRAFPNACDSLQPAFDLK